MARPIRYTIHAVIPADGWMAVYKDRDGGLHTQPVVAWALCTDEDGPTSGPGSERFLHPMTVEDTWASLEKDDNFEALTHPGMWRPFVWGEHDA